MNLNTNIFIFVVIICVTRNYIEGRLTDVVQTDKGKVQGRIVKTIQDDSIEYSSFRGIPFAKPPIGKLRFQPPVESDEWSQVLNATSEASSCPQINEYINDYDGDEDCLYLNVYSPKTSFNENDNKLVAVMVWIHGGSFTGGSKDQVTHGPDFLIANDVIVVAINYRLGVLGFLSLDIDGATGNMGLKDQVLALKWVQKNIKNFGGDPNKVTIFGESAGSICVTLHQLSPASRGLFRGVIGMSGSPLNRWAFTPISLAVKQAFDIGKQLGINNFNKTELLNKLREVSPKELVKAVTKIIYDDSKERTSFLTLTPTSENPKIAKDIFLSDCPLNIYKKKNYSMIPIIIGFTNVETLLTLSQYQEISHWAKLSRNYLYLLGLEESIFVDNLNVIINDPQKDLNHFSNDVIYSVVNLTSDLHFNIGIDSLQKYLTVNSKIPIYYYRNSFDYEESSHRQAGIDFDGCAHADDVAHIFWQPIKNQPSDPNSRIGIHRARMARLWTNFAKYLNPTPNDPTTDHLLNFTWVPSGLEGLRLEIDNQHLKMEPRIVTDIMKVVQASGNPFEHANCLN